ncbi:hypothetical protein L484_024682 [Morus notabilis]|uniref:Defensin-like protein n=1 Tax=Morus notabilis TaxID=981085 RepID=W9R4U2_9ROSA|nr:hypothetical protein L484_024682 [Morus notabilis]
MKSSLISAILLLFLVLIAAGSVSAQTCPKTLYDVGPDCKDDMCTRKCTIAYGANSKYGACHMNTPGDFFCICYLIHCN